MQVNRVDRSDHVSIKFSISEHENAERRRVCWKATGQPTVRKHREKWTVRIEGIDTETGNRRPRQIGTYVRIAAHRVGRRARVPDERTNEAPSAAR